MRPDSAKFCHFGNFWDFFVIGKLLEPTLAIFYDPDQNFLGCKRPKIEKKILQSGCTFIISYYTIKTNAQIAPIAQWIRCRLWSWVRIPSTTFR